MASLGGLEAFSPVLGGLPASLAVPIAVVQHRRHIRGDPDWLAVVLVRRTELSVAVADAGGYPPRRGVTVVPRASPVTIGLTGARMITHASSSHLVDTLLISSATAAPTIAVTLTGGPADGARGCRAVKAYGRRLPGALRYALQRGCHRLRRLRIPR